MSKPLQTLISLDLLLDYNSLLFALLRSHFLLSNISIAPVTKLAIEMKSPEQAFDDLCNEIKHPPSLVFKSEFVKTFRFYLQTIKPQIFALAFTKYLKQISSKIYLTSYLDPENIEVIMKAHKSWLDFPVIRYNKASDIEEFIKTKVSPNESQYLLIDGNFELVNSISLKNPEELYVLIKNSNFKCKNSFDDIKNSLIHPYIGFEDIEFSKVFSGFMKQEPLVMEKFPKEYILDFSKPPLSQELNFWGNIIPFTEPLILESQIIRGFGRGGKQLGMPTANLEITREINELLKPIIPGIYYGWVWFNKEKSKDCDGLQFDKRYDCVISTGFNPFYENKEKTFEVYVMEKFEKDYYGAFIRVEVKGFIRCESDLKYFDHLIKMIHNDVELAKQVLNENKKK